MLHRVPPTNVGATLYETRLSVLDAERQPPNAVLSLREDHHFHRPMKGDAGLEDQSLQAAGQAA